MKVYFDASVLIAALLAPSGGSALLLQYVKQKRIVGVTSQSVIDEIITIEKQIKFGKSQVQIEEFVLLSELLVHERVNNDDIEPYLELIDAEDAHLLAGAKLSKCSYLVTLDKRHVLRDDVQGRFPWIKIVNPGQLIERLVGRE